MINYDKIKPLKRPLRELLESGRLFRKALYWYQRNVVFAAKEIGDGAASVKECLPNAPPISVIAKKIDAHRLQCGGDNQNGNKQDRSDE